MTNKLLIVVDMQNDFITGSLGTPEAKAIVPNVVNKIENWSGDIIVTKDYHTKNYLETLEGKKLPVKHCIVGTQGVELEDFVTAALSEKARTLNSVRNVYLKPTFGAVALLYEQTIYDEIQIVGLCTDICVLANAVMARTHWPNTPVIVDAFCCAGSTPENHQIALKAMKQLQIDIINE